jgi:GMP synthase (glutamine-hydrolysing)
LDGRAEAEIMSGYRIGFNAVELAAAASVVERQGKTIAEPAADDSDEGTAPSVLIIKHVPWEGPGAIAEVLDGFSVRTINVAAQTKPVLPRVDELSALVVMGGPMAADDVTRFPGLAAERELLADAVNAGLPTLGICLGAQLLGLALGAELCRGASPELGWAPVDVHAADDPIVGALARDVPVLHWHADAISLPEGAELLASTHMTSVQAFRVANAWGLQFHIEVTDELIARWLCNRVMSADAHTRLGPDWEGALTTQTAKALPALEHSARSGLAYFARLARDSSRAGRTANE